MHPDDRRELELLQDLDMQAMELEDQHARVDRLTDHASARLYLVTPADLLEEGYLVTPADLLEQELSGWREDDANWQRRALQSQARSQARRTMSKIDRRDEWKFRAIAVASGVTMALALVAALEGGI